MRCTGCRLRFVLVNKLLHYLNKIHKILLHPPPTCVEVTIGVNIRHAVFLQQLDPLCMDSTAQAQHISRGVSACVYDTASSLGSSFPDQAHLQSIIAEQTSS